MWGQDGRLLGVKMSTQQHADIIAALSGVGLSESEISVYQATLELGSRPASIIAKKAGLKRGHTYNVLSQLAERGIIQEFVKNSVRHFTCSPPDSLLGVLEHRENELTLQKERIKKIIPKLEALKNPNHSQARVRFFQGVDGVKEIYEDTLRTPDITIHALADPCCSCTTMGDDIDDWMVHYVRRRTAQNIFYKGIWVKSNTGDKVIRKRKSSKRELKMIGELDLPVVIFVYGPRTAIVSAHHETVGLIIENKPIADTLRNIHQAVWDMLPDYDLAPDAEAPNLSNAIEVLTE